MQSPRPQMLISVPMARIFIIEDNPELREMLCRLMVAEGHLVTLACNGQEAQTLDWKQPPDLVITDIYMPDRDGLEVISDLQKKRLGTKIIAITGRATAGGVLAMATALGAVRVLTKPFQPEELVEIVNEVLRRNSPRTGS